MPAESEYWRTWWMPSGIRTVTLTYCPGRLGVTGVSSAGSRVKVIASVPATALPVTTQGASGLSPGRGDLSGDHVAEFVGDGLEEVPVDDVVLLGADIEGDMLVSDAGKHGLRGGVRIFDQVGCEDGNAAGQGLLLGSALLVGTAEQAIEEFGVSGEHAAVKILGDTGHAFTDDRQCCIDQSKGVG